jgi:hypothetical protein
VNDYRTFLWNPGADGRRALKQIDKMPMDASVDAKQSFLAISGCGDSVFDKYVFSEHQGERGKLCPGGEH